MVRIQTRIAMAAAAEEELAVFLSTGVYRIRRAPAFFMDPVRVLNRTCSRFRLSPSSYYSRFFAAGSGPSGEPRRAGKKRRRRSPPEPNEREAAAARRHQEARIFLLEAYEAFLEEKELISRLSYLRENGSTRDECIFQQEDKSPFSFVEFGKTWQAPLCEMLLSVDQNIEPLDRDKGWLCAENGGGSLVKVFDNLVVNDTDNDVEAKFLDRYYILPRRSSFYMSDLKQIGTLIPAQSVNAFNLIIIDPPWENGSARQKSLYPTLPNKYLLALPIKQFVHSEGALVAIWVTNREKLRVFVERELLLAWGINTFTCVYWLKVKADGSLICDLDLPHHKPYECLLLGYNYGKDEMGDKSLPSFVPLPDNQVLISIPGDHSRKPPIGKLLSQYVPGSKPPRCLELFARSMTAECTSWGNEPLHFQESKYFMRDERPLHSCDK